MESEMKLTEGQVKPVKKVYLPPNRRNPPPESLNIKNANTQNISNTTITRRQFNGSDLTKSSKYRENYRNEFRPQQHSESRTDQHTDHRTEFRTDQRTQRDNCDFRSEPREYRDNREFRSESNAVVGPMVERNIPLTPEDMNSFSSNIDRNLRISTDKTDRTSDRTSDRIITERTSDRIISDRTISDRTSERTIGTTSERSIGDRTIGDRTIGTTSDRTIGDRMGGKHRYVGKAPTLWAIRGDRRYYEEKESEVFEPMNRMSTGINFNSYDNIPVQMTGHDSSKIKPIEEFDTSVHPKLVPNIRKVNYTKPTPIQKHSIPVILAGRDLMACAQTGSGKTAAFLLPIVTSMLRTGPPKQPSLSPLYGSRVALPVCLVLSPTRELAVQIFSESRKFNFGTGIRTVVLYGGSEVRRQLIELERGCDICVATPGRLTDLVERRKIIFSCIKYLVLDEADRMLDMGFSPQIKAILAHPTMTPSTTNTGGVSSMNNSMSTNTRGVSSMNTGGVSNSNSMNNSMTNRVTNNRIKDSNTTNSNTVNTTNARDTVNPVNTRDTIDNSIVLVRQTVMFSATFPKEIQQLAREFLSDYIYLAVGRVGSTNEFIKQRLLYADQDQKIKYLIKLLRDNSNLGGLVLIFVETKKRADLIEGYLLSENFKAVNIHGDRSQEDREKALSLFKAGVRPIMVATDVAARGLDISNITHVINCDLPTNIDDYVHRIGRTGRAGNIGIATSLVNESNRPILKDLLLLLQESNQEIPLWFKKLVNTISRRNNTSGNSSGGNTNNSSSNMRRHGITRDVRDDVKSKFANTAGTFQEFEDDWW